MAVAAPAHFPPLVDHWCFWTVACFPLPNSLRRRYPSTAGPREAVLGIFTGHCPAPGSGPWAYLISDAGSSARTSQVKSQDPLSVQFSLDQCSVFEAPQLALNVRVELGVKTVFTFQSRALLLFLTC